MTETLHEVLLDINFDEIIPCKVCPTEASWIIVTKCCNLESFCCDGHMERWLKESREMLSVFDSLECKHCKKSIKTLEEFCTWRKI